MKHEGSTPPYQFELPRELPWILLVVILALELYRRLFLGYIPHDFGAYLAAADVATRGLDPYGPAIFDSPYYQGYPYIYPPASLSFATLLALAPAPLVTALDAIMRVAILVGSVIFLKRRMQIELALPTLLLAACLFAPFAFDLMTGNLETYMFCGLLVLVDSAHKHWLKALVLGLTAAVLFVFKPMWYIPAVALLISQRNWPALCGLIVGACAGTGLTIADSDLFASWLVRLAEVREFYPAVNFLEISPWLYGVVVTLWVCGGLAILGTRGASSEVWVYACTSIVIWPRSDLYSYMIFLPVIFYLLQRIDLRRGLALGLPLIGPLPWILASYDRLFNLSVLLLWACIVTVLVAFLLIRQDEQSTT